jgi:hypothetical protein
VAIAACKQVILRRNHTHKKIHIRSQSQVELKTKYSEKHPELSNKRADLLATKKKKKRSTRIEMEPEPSYRIPYKTVKGVARGLVAKNKVPGLKK